MLHRKIEKGEQKGHPYLWMSAIIMGLFLIIFLAKGIYPFGNNSLIWGDMYDQVTAFFYHLYDSFYHGQSMFIDFTTSGGINFFGILTYYLASPLHLLILLFPREHIYQAISIIIALKVLLCGLTFLAFIRYYFKKLPNYISVFLALLYAFCGYNILFYQITGWIDVVILFPLLMIGYKKLLDFQSPFMYLFFLTLSFIVSFYISFLMVIFLFFAAFIYLYCFHKEKAYQKKAITSLGLATGLSILLSSFIWLPSLLEISVSSRAGFDLNTILNSGGGPLADKFAFFLTSGFTIAILFFLFIKGRKEKRHKPFLKFLTMIFILLLIPVVVEPVNKLWHFGSYAFFPLRTFFTFFFVALTGCAYYFERVNPSSNQGKKRRLRDGLLVFCGMILMSVVVICFYGHLQKQIYKISLTSHVEVLAVLLWMAFLVGGITYLLHRHYQSDHKSLFILLYPLLLCNILCSCFLYFGIDFAQGTLTGVYEDMTAMEESYQEGDYYRVKSIYPRMVMNYGMVSRYDTWDHFTSLTAKENLKTLKRLGYSSYWVKTYSSGGTLFTDAMLGNQYLIANREIASPRYQYVDRYGSIYFYRYENQVPFGFPVVDNITLVDSTNAFDAQNKLYQAIMGTEEPLLTIYPDLLETMPVGLTITENTKWKDDTVDGPFYEIEMDSEEQLAYVEQTISVDDREILYLEILRSLDNQTNQECFEAMHVYVNGKLLAEKYPSELENGLLELGEFEQEDVTIRIEFVRDTILHHIAIGGMHVDRYQNFLRQKTADVKIAYDENQVHVFYQNEDGQQLLYLPLAYNEGYHLTVNGKEAEIIPLFDNFIGVPLAGGANEITLTYTPPGLYLGLIVSFLTLIITFVLISSGLYHKLCQVSFLNCICYYGYLGIYVLLLVGMYLLPILCFFLSFFIKIRI